MTTSPCETDRRTLPTNERTYATAVLPQGMEAAWRRRPEELYREAQGPCLYRQCRCYRLWDERDFRSLLRSPLTTLVVPQASRASSHMTSVDSLVACRGRLSPSCSRGPR